MSTFENYPIINECSDRDIDVNSNQPFIQFPDILVGREKETKELIEAFNSVCFGSSAVTLISGHAGSGKTTLVKKIRDKAVEKGALFVSGKADQYSTNIPYETFTQFVKMLVNSLLMLNDSQLVSFRKILTDTLGKDINLLSDLIPEVKYITGYTVKNKKPADGNPENRFKNTITTFLKITAAQYCSLIIFVDDMHWTDSATIKIIKHIIDEKIPGLYIIGAYRINEISKDHAIVKMITEAELSSGEHHILNIESLNYNDVEDIITLTLEDNSPRIKKLSAYVFKKTGGNPFYLREFIQNLIIKKCLLYENCCWRWDEYKSTTMPATENVLNLLSDKINTLSDNEQKILKMSACIGNSFSAELLILILNTKRSIVSGILHRLERENYIITKDNSGVYAFSHDKIHEAAYDLMTTEQKSEMHGIIGEMLLRLSGTADEQIFAVTDHLNRADKRMTDISELAKLNFDAGLKAKNNFAYDAAISYLEKSADLYKTAGNKDRNLNFRIINAYSECLYLNAEYEKSEMAAYKAIELTDEVLEKCNIYNRVMMMKSIQLKYDESADIGLNALKPFGIRFESDMNMREKQLEEIRSTLTPLLNKISVGDILNLPECKRPDIHTITQLLKNLSGALYHLGDWEFSYMVHSKTISLTLEHGITVDSPEGFIGHAMICIVLWNDIKLGSRLGDAAWKLSNKYGNLSQLSDVGLHYGSYILFREKHLKYSLDIFQRGLDAGLKSGEYLFAGYTINHLIFNRIATGENLHSLLYELDKNLTLLCKLKNELIYDNLSGVKIILSNLAGRTEDTECFILNDLKEQKLLACYDEKKIFLLHAVYALYKSMLLYLYGDYKGSLLLCENVKKYNNGILGTFHIIEYYFYLALNLTELIPENRGYYTLLEEPALMFKEYALECPDNFLCRHLLIEAETKRLDNDISGAMSLYDNAIASARENEFIHIEAIACEKAGKFWLSLSKKDFASIYLKRAYTLFGKWGADRKMDHMKKQYPDIFHEHSGLNELSGSDIFALLNHFNRISCSLDINDLLKNLSRIMLYHSGADMFALATDHDDRMLIRIQAKPDISETAEVIMSLPVEECHNEQFPLEMLRYIKRTNEKEIFYDGNSENIFYNTPYMKKINPASALCIMSDAGSCKVIMYFENRHSKYSYNGINKTLLNLLSKHASIYLQNAFYIRDTSFKTEETAFVFKTSGLNKAIPYENILYFSSNGRHTSVFLNSKVLDIPVLLKDIENNLPPECFIRVHKQHIININNISDLKRNNNGRIFVNINNSVALPVGRAYYETIKEKLNMQIIKNQIKETTK